MSPKTEVSLTSSEMSSTFDSAINEGVQAPRDETEEDEQDDDKGIIGNFGYTKFIILIFVGLIVFILLYDYGPRYF